MSCNLLPSLVPFFLELKQHDNKGKEKAQAFLGEASQHLCRPKPLCAGTVLRAKTYSSSSSPFLLQPTELPCTFTHLENVTCDARENKEKLRKGRKEKRSRNKEWPLQKGVYNRDESALSLQR